MSVTIDIPPAIEAQAVTYERETGVSLETLFIDYLRERFLQRQKAKGASLVRKLREIRSNQPKLEGEPYRFCRQDAYEEPIDDRVS